MLFKSKWVLTLLIAVFLLSHCKTAKKKAEAPEATVSEAEVVETAEAVKLDPIPASYLPSLAVNGDACFAYLKPERKDTAFGPLKRGEGLKRLGVDKGWVKVWIPRLRLAGWVREGEASPSESPETNNGTIPVELLPTAEVTKEQVNILEEPSAGSAVIHQAMNKEVLYVLGEKDGWFQFWVPQVGKSGWTYGKLEGLPEPVAAPEPQKVVEEEELAPSNLFQSYAVSVESAKAFLEPDTPDTSIGDLPKGEGLKKLGADQGWIRVWIPRLRQSCWLKESDASSTEDPEVDEGGIPLRLITILEVAKSRVNVRAKSSVKSKILHVAKENEAYYKLNEKKGWCQIWIPDIEKKGWIYGKLVREK